jgi:hypothetical protein
MGGTYTPENVVLLTVVEHAKAHHQLFLEHGRLQDKLAWLMLSGQTEEGERLRRQISSERMRLLWQDPSFRIATCRKISETKLGHATSLSTRKKLSNAALGQHHTKKTRRKISQTLMGHVVTIESRQKMSAAKMGNTNRLGKKQ